jgi:two-component system chemotaxis response regulator CheB
VIGASTGGPAAVMTVMKSLTSNFPAPIVIVQHIYQGFSEGFSSWLERNLPFGVSLAGEGDRLAAGRVLVAPDGFHTVLEAGRVHLTDDPPINSCKPSVDALFLSAAEVYRENTVGVVLTGMGSDGAKGAKAIKTRGGHVIVQDEESCVVFGMPQSAIQIGAADEVLPLNDIAEALVSQVMNR